MNQNERDIDEQLLLQYLLGDVSPDDRAYVDEWLRISETHRKQLDRLEAVWLETGKLTPSPVAVDVDAAWNRVSGRMEIEDEKQHEQKQRGAVIPMVTLRWMIGVAAVLILGFGFWWLARKLSTEPPPTTLTATGEILKDTLPDGSAIVLNIGSVLVYPEKFTDGLRKVDLSGEGFFEVKSDPDKPFEVNTDIARIRVIGTSFNVKAYPGGNVEVSVSSGTVNLSPIKETGGDISTVSLHPGMKGVLARHALVPVVLPDTTSDRLFWLHHTLEFRQTPLREVFELLHLHYRITVTPESPEILSCRLTATFSNESPETILRIIAGSFDLIVEKNKQTYLLKGKGCHE